MTIYHSHEVSLHPILPMLAPAESSSCQADAFANIRQGNISAGICADASEDRIIKRATGQHGLA